MENIIDLKICGQGSSGGGKFRDVVIKGSGQIRGDVECNNYEVYGSGDIKGNLIAEKVQVNGQAKFEGEIKTSELKVQGETDFKGDIFADEASVTGSMRTSGDLNAEICEIEGGFDIGGLLNVDLLELTMYWPCKVKEIGGTKIKINNDNKFSFLGIKNIIMPHSTKRILEVDTIEADEIYLESTHAKVVRGKKIILGPECRIDLIEYEDSFQDHEKSIVESIEKL